ncbi:MAG: PD-(D/E)XK nuclease domain-containing protein [Marinagarivorans sp.]|nr:PD-(D/E)XK nuclease domain-containing protein [Marinagarivorans sp.]
MLGASRDCADFGDSTAVSRFNNTTFIFEFKVVKDKPTGQAIAQIETNNYAQKYIQDGWKIFGVGVEFSKSQRQVVMLEARELV